MATRKKHPLSHMIPPAIFAEEYVSRVINGIRDLDLVQYARDAQRNLLLFGPTGPGKTSLVLAYAAANQIPMVTISCNGGMDPATVLGMPVMDEAGRVKYQEGQVLEVIRYGGILYLDEVNFLHPKIAAVFHELLDKRRSITVTEKLNEQIVAHPDLQIIAAYNPDYEGTRPLNPAFRNRFPLKVPFEYEPAVERQLVSLPSLLEVAEKLRRSAKEGVLTTPVSTNMLSEFEDFAIDLGIEFALENFLSTFASYERSSVREVFDMNISRLRAEVADLERKLAE